jgi:hypothetical protein
VFMTCDEGARIFVRSASSSSLCFRFDLSLLSFCSSEVSIEFLLLT